MTMLNIPWKFPDQHEQCRREAERYRGLSFEQRLAIVVELRKVSEELLRASPNRTRQLELLNAIEQVGNQRMREFIRSQLGRKAR